MINPYHIGRNNIPNFSILHRHNRRMSFVYNTNIIHWASAVRSLNDPRTWRSGNWICYHHKMQFWEIMYLKKMRLCMITKLNLLALELFFYFSTPVYKMWIIQEPNTLELWNKLHLKREKKRRVYTMFKMFSTYICWINI